MDRELVSVTPARWWAHWFAGYSDNRRLLVYALSVITSGLSVLALAGWQADRSDVWSFVLVAWFVINLASELLWLETTTGEGTDSMALTMNFAAILLLEPAVSIWVISFSVLIATRFIQKRDMFKTFFGLAQMALTAAVTTTLFHLLHRAPLTVEAFRSFSFVSAMLLCAAVYFFVNTFLVAGALSLMKGQRLWPTWRENYGYRNNIVSSVALFSLAPVLLLAYLSIGFFGVFLFFLPLLIIKEQNREYIRMQRMMLERVDQEKMAERGKLAAGVAHEMNNYLAIITGRVQLLSLRAEKHGDEKMKADAEVIREQIDHMRLMAKGLMDFVHRGIKTEPMDINRFLVRQIDLLRPHPVLKGVEILPELSPEVGIAEFDPGQIGQVLVNLIKNAAEAIKGQETIPETPMLTIRSQPAKGDRVRIAVEDNGPGMPRAVQEKIFDAFFTTKKDGHGFGLATCRTILTNHKGKIWVESEVGKGTTFFLEFPRRSPDSRAASSSDAAKAAAARVEGAKPDTAKVGTGKAEAANVGTGKPETANVGTGKAETANVETAKAEPAKVGTGKADTAKVGARKADAANADAGNPDAAPMEVTEGAQSQGGKTEERAKPELVPTQTRRPPNATDVPGTATPAISDAPPPLSPDRAESQRPQPLPDSPSEAA